MQGISLKRHTSNKKHLYFEILCFLFCATRETSVVMPSRTLHLYVHIEKHLHTFYHCKSMSHMEIIGVIVVQISID